MRIKNHLLVLLAFSLISIMLTWPLILYFTTNLPGPLEDNLQSLWNFWWVRRAVWEQHIHPYYTSYLFYPTGTSLAFHTLSLFNTLIGIVLQFIFNLIGSYNIMILLGFILSGWTTYMLVYHLTRNHGAAWIGGVIFAFSPYHFAHALHHINLASTQFIPLYVLGLIKVVDEQRCFGLSPDRNHKGQITPLDFRPGDRPKNQGRWALAAGGSLFLAALCCWYYLTYLAIFTLFFLAWLGLTQPRIFTGQFWRSLIVMGGIAAVLILPFAYPMLKETYYHMPYMVKETQLDFSADLLAFFTPPPGWLWGKLNLVREAYRNFTALEWEAVVFLGFTALALAVASIPSAFRPGDRPKDRIFWWVSGIGFAVLAIGPRLHVWGKIWLPWLPLPYSLLHRIPLIGMSSVPSRFAVMVMLSLAVLASYGAAEILKPLRRSTRNMVLIGLTCLILLEYADFPLPVSNPEEFAHMHLFSKFAQDKEDYAILELPLTDYWPNEIYMYRQTGHHKRLIFGSVSRLSMTAIKPVLDSPLGKLCDPTLILPPDYFRQIKPLLLQNKIRYIVLNRYMYQLGNNKSKADEINLLLKETFPLETSCGNEVFIYRVKGEG